MNITILTYGSRGDVQPFVALALGLQKNGHIVKLAAPYGQFPPEIRKKYDVIVITRTWSFTQGDQVRAN